MKLGLLADIHEHINHLQAALDHFQNLGVDQIMVIGDVFDCGTNLRETCQLLSNAGALGVWGNHDYGLCAEPDDEMRRRYGDPAIEFLTSFRARWDLGGCHFTHVEPWLDPNNIMDLWYFEGPPDTSEKLARIFATSHRLMFAGHYHQWLLATPDGLGEWAGDGPISLSGNRYFVVIGALCQGRFAVFDTENSLLTPFNLGAIR